MDPAAAEVPAHVARWREAVDWERARSEAVEVLSAYLATDTVNPPGNEDRGAAFLAGVLDGEGIPWWLVPLAEGRSSLVARLPGDGSGGGPLCLMHHVDVASAEPERWTEGRGPLSGAVADGAVWGRGALDMKGMGVVELLSMVWLARLEVPLARDVVLLAVADEEVSNLGARSLAAPEVWRDLRCTHLLNEGGIGIRGALFEGHAVHPISVAEKGALWIRMIAEGQAGHGSVPRGDVEAPTRLLAAMRALEDGWRPDYRVDPAVYDLLHAVGEEKGGFTGAVLKSKLLVRTLAWPQLVGNPVTAATMSDTLHLTGTGGANEPNVVPSEVWAQYDARLLPGTDPEEVLAELRRLTRKIDGIRFETTFSLGSNRSPADDPLFGTIARYAVEGRTDAAVGPLLSVGFTDSLILRPLGVTAYGYVPFEVSAEIAETMHGHDERLPVDELGDGLRRMFSIVVDAAGRP